MLRTLDLGKFTKALGSQIVVDAPSDRAFKYLAADFPHKTLNEIETLVTSVKPTKVEIDIKLSNLDKMSNNGIKTTKAIGARLKNRWFRKNCFSCRHFVCW